MKSIEHFNKKNLKYDQINKFTYKNTEELPKLKKIILNLGCKNNSSNQIATNLLALEFISCKKSFITCAKRPNITFKIRKGNPSGCKTVFRKRGMFEFFTKMSTEIFPNIKNFQGIITKNCLKHKNAVTYQLKHVLNFIEIERHYSFFKNITDLKITFVTNSKKEGEMLFLLKTSQVIFK